MFNLGKKYGHVPKFRTRLIEAPRMDKNGHGFFNDEPVYTPPNKTHFCTLPNVKLHNFHLYEIN